MGNGWIQKHLQEPTVKPGDLVRTNYFGCDNHYGIIIDVNLSYPWNPHYHVLLTTGKMHWFDRKYFIAVNEIDDETR